MDKVNELIKLLKLIRYKKEIAKYQSKRRIKSKKEQEDSNKFIKNLQLECGVTPKPKANYQECCDLITMVLESCDSGTKVIKRYAIYNNKNTEWKRSISRQRVGNVFKSALASHEEHPVILEITSNNIYCNKDIENNSISGALTKLSKQLALSKEKDYSENEKAKLKELLLVKQNSNKSKTNWDEVQKFRDKGCTVRELAAAFNVSKSAVSKYTVKR